MENKSKILIVDDEDVNLLLMEEILLSFGYDIALAENGTEALDLVAADPPDLILLDIMMPGMDGYEVCRRLKASDATKRIPVIFVTARNDIKDEATGFKVGAADYITKPVSPPIVQERVRTHLALYDQNRVLEEKVLQRTAELVEANSRLEKSYFQTVEFTFDLLNLYDEFLGGHCKRVAQYSNLIAQKLEFDNKARRDLVMASLLHDIGLAGFPHKELINMYSGQPISSAILFQYNQHPLISTKLISSIERFSRIAEIIATHHENMDGSGFPNGLVGNDIPLEGRIIAVADRYDIINKIESKGRSFDESISTMIGAESVKYDEYVLDALTEVLKKGDPFSQTAEIHLNEVKAGMTLAKPLTNVDGVTLLSTGTRLRKDHIDIIMRYAGQGKLEEPISVYTKWSS